MAQPTPEPKCGKAKLIRMCQLWRKLIEQGAREANLRVYLQLFYGVTSRLNLTPDEADKHIAECSEQLNFWMATRRVAH